MSNRSSRGEGMQTLKRREGGHHIRSSGSKDKARLITMAKRGANGQADLGEDRKQKN